MALAPKESLDQRIAAVRRALADKGLEALVVSHLPNLFFLTNVSASAGVALLTPRILYLVIDFRYSAAVARLQEEGYGPSGIDVREASGSLDDEVAKLVRELGVARVGIEGAHLPVDQFRWWEAAVAPVIPEPVGRPIEAVRLRKDAFEIGVFREAGRLISRVAGSVLAEVVRPGRTELDIAADIDWHMKRSGFSKPAFETIVASGPQAALPHARPTARLVEQGDLVVLDFGGVLNGYCVDITRTVAMGRASAEGREWHQAVCEAQAMAMASVRPGVLAHEVDRAARTTLEARGLGKAFGHATGHGLGLDVHEDPRLGREVPGRPPVRLEPGMVCTIEPGVYFPGKGGVRIEDDVLVTNEGYERLTDIPYDLVVN